MSLDRPQAPKLNSNAAGSIQVHLTFFEQTRSELLKDELSSFTTDILGIGINHNFTTNILGIKHHDGHCSSI